MRSKSVCLAVAAALIVALWSGTARADLDNPVHNGVKGAIGLGLLGADLVLIIEGAVGVRNPWLLTLIPIAVAGGGAAGGWFAGGGNQEAPEQGYPTAAVPLLVAGIALIIPAAILVAHGRSYRASRDDEGFVDRTDEGGPLEGLDDFSGDDDDGGTQTEVVGPEEGEGVPAPAPAPPPAQEEAPAAPPDEGGEGEPSASTLSSATYASVQIDAQIPVGGMLRLVAQESSRLSSGLQLQLAYF